MPHSTRGYVRLTGAAARRRTRYGDLKEISADIGPVVYMIRCADGLIKIGYTADIGTRKKFFGLGWNGILVIKPGTKEDETALLTRFAAHRARGREYFHPHRDLIDYADEERQRMGVPPVDVTLAKSRPYQGEVS